MARQKPPQNPAIPSLYGLVLAGGRGTRLSRDKGSLDYHGLPQALWAYQLLEPVCGGEHRFVSVRGDQLEAAPYLDLPTIADEGEGGGPAAGLLAALNRFPAVAWLTVAADMPLLTPRLLATLVAQRDPAVIATAFRHADGTPEPLCAIWEPAARAVIAAAATPAEVSLRRLLEANPAKLIAPDDERALASVNTPAEEAAARQVLERRKPPVM